MAKKVKNSKKHQLKYAQPTNISETKVAGMTAGVAVKESVLFNRDFSYVSKDVRRLSLLAGSLLAVELLLWYLMNHTGLGTAVYNLIKI
jgi:hypothetical protein